jgi:hypothetical protein
MPVAISHGTDMIAKMYVIRPPLSSITSPCHGTTLVRVFHGFMKKCLGCCPLRTLKPLFNRFDSRMSRAHKTCTEGFGTIECTSTRLTPDPEDCPPGESLIKIMRFGNLSRVCAPGGGSGTLSKRCWLSVRIPRRSQRGGLYDTLA